MPTVYDRDTMQPVAGSPEELAAGIASGKYAFDANSPVQLKGDDGLESFSADEAAEKIAAGSHSLPTHAEEYQEQVNREEAAKGLPESIGQGVASGVNQALLGVPEAITSHLETPEQKAHREAVEQAHHAARVVGGIGGIGASLLAGGEVFKGLEMAGKAAAGLALPAEEAATAGLTRRLAAKAVELGTQGAALAAPQALVHAAFGDVQQASETLAWGAGLGAVLGVPAELLSSAGSAIGSALKPGGAVADKIEGWADNLTPKAMGAQKSQILKIPTERREELVKFAHDAGLIKPGMSKEDIGEAVRAAYEERSDGVGDTIKALDDTWRDAAAKGGAFQERAPTPEEAALLDAHMTPGKIGDAIRDHFDTPEMKMPMNSDAAAAVQKVVDSAYALPTVKIGGREIVSFEAAQTFKQNLYSRWGGAVKKVQNQGGLKGQQVITPLDEAKSQAYDIVKNLVNKASEDVALASGKPELVGKLAQHNKELSMLHTLKDWTGNAEAQQLGNKGIGLTDWLAMKAGGVAGAAFGALGGPIGAGAGALAGGLASHFVKHWAEDKGLIYLSTAAKRAAAGGDSNVFAATLGADAQARLKATMDGVQATVKNMALQGIQATAARKNEHLKALLGGETTGLSSAQQLKKLQDRVQTLSSNPAALAAATSAVVGPLAVAAPQVADAVQKQLAGQVQYLAQATPKAPRPPAPFAPQSWSATDAQQLAFHDKAEIVASPMAAMKHMQQGTLSDAHLDALKTNYPVIYDEMKKQIITFAAEHPDVKLPVAERASVAKFLGVSLDAMDSPDAVRALQATYAGQPADGTAPKQPKMSGTKLKNAPSHSTTYGATQGPSEDTQ